MTPTLVLIKGDVITDIPKGFDLKELLNLTAQKKYSKSLVYDKPNLMRLERPDAEGAGDTLLVFDDRRRLSMVKHNIVSGNNPGVKFDALFPDYMHAEQHPLTLNTSRIR